MADTLANFAFSTVATAPSPASSGATLVVAAGEGARFPSVFPFDVSIYPAGVQPSWAVGAATGGNVEIAICTNRVTDTLTLTRAQRGTTARVVLVGDTVEQPPFAKTFTDLVPKSLVTTAGDLVYATASAVLARLGIGTAGQVLRTNAGATAPAWTTAASSRSATNPTGRATNVMMGLAASITPVVTGKVLIHMAGAYANSNLGAISTITIRYGTGTAPANNAAVTGTVLEATPDLVEPVAGYAIPWALNALVTGLTLGTAYWIDVSINMNAGTVTLTGVTTIAVEI